VVRFEYHGVPARWRNQRVYCLVLDRPVVDVCFTDPGFDVDLVVSADIAAMGRVWTGHLTFAQAIRAGGNSDRRPGSLVEAFPSWFLLSPFAAVSPASLARGPEGTAPARRATSSARA
jgi:hypothetical protein